MNLNRSFPVRALIPLLWMLTPSTALSQYSFSELPGLGGDAMSLSPDGTTIYGSTDSPGFGQPFYYRDGQTTILPLATFPGNGSARGGAPDGTIVGQSRINMNQTSGDAAVWRNGNLSYLERAPGGETADARAISLDGHVIVGRAGLATFKNQPARWVDGHIEPLGDIPGSNSSGVALAVSADGSVIVGEAGGSDTAFRWINGAMEALPLINGPDISDSTAFDVSADGRRIVGQQTHFSFLTDGLLWEDGVPRNLGYLPGANRTFAEAISDDGSLIFGESGVGFTTRAFIWDDVNGMRDLMQVLADAGADLYGWSRLDFLLDVSSDGRTVFGTGINAQGNPAYFLATIPEPGTLSLAAASFVLFGIRRGRGR